MKFKLLFTIISGISLLVVGCSSNDGAKSSVEEPHSINASSNEQLSVDVGKSEEQKSSSEVESSNSQAGTSSSAQASSSSAQASSNSGIEEKVMPGKGNSRGLGVNGIVLVTDWSWPYVHAWNDNGDITPSYGEMLDDYIGDYIYISFSGIESCKAVFLNDDDEQSPELTISGIGFHYYLNGQLTDSHPNFPLSWGSSYNVAQYEWTKLSNSEVDSIVEKLPATNFAKVSVSTHLFDSSTYKTYTQENAPFTSSIKMTTEWKNTVPKREVFRCEDDCEFKYVMQTPSDSTRFIRSSIAFFDKNGYLLERQVYENGKVIQKITYEWTFGSSGSSTQTWKTKWASDRILKNIPQPQTLGDNCSISSADSAFEGRAGAIFQNGAGSTVNDMISYVDRLKSSGYQLTSSSSNVSWTLNSSKYTISLGRSNSESTIVVIEK